MLLDSAIDRLYTLNVGVTGVGGERHERPQKPLLLLAAFDLIDEGLATPGHIPWCQALRDRFTARFDLIRKHDDQNSPENPFFYLRGDGSKASPPSPPLASTSATPSSPADAEGLQWRCEQLIA